MGRGAGLRLSILIGIGTALAAVAGAHAQSLPAVLGDEWQAPAEHRARFNPLSPTPDTLRRGRSLYFQNCVLCHGDKGQGDGPLSRMHAQRTGQAPRDLSSTRVQSQMTDGEIFWKVTNGWRKQGKIIMPAFGEDHRDEDIWSLVLYIRSLNRQQASK